MADVIEIVKRIERLVNEISTIAEDELQPIFEYCPNKQKTEILRQLLRKIDKHTAELWEFISDFYDEWPK